MFSNCCIQHSTVTTCQLQGFCRDIFTSERRNLSRFRWRWCDFSFHYCVACTIQSLCITHDCCCWFHFIYIYKHTHDNIMTTRVISLVNNVLPFRGRNNNTNSGDITQNRIMVPRIFPLRNIHMLPRKSTNNNIVGTRIVSALTGILPRRGTSDSRNEGDKILLDYPVKDVHEESIPQPHHQYDHVVTMAVYCIVFLVIMWSILRYASRAGAIGLVVGNADLMEDSMSFCNCPTVMAWNATACLLERSHEWQEQMHVVEQAIRTELVSFGA